MAQSGFTGISFPFRINSRGGVSMSTTSATDSTHIKESIQQIFLTNYLERPMEGGDVYTTISNLLFEPNNIALQQVLKTRMVDDLIRLEPRIRCAENDIDFEAETTNGVEILYATLTYTVIKYNTTYTSKIEVGEIGRE